MLSLLISRIIEVCLDTDSQEGIYIIRIQQKSPKNWLLLYFINKPYNLPYVK